jgi:hypothetical protein
MFLVQYVPVDTIICFRASCPLVIAIIEYFYLDRELPSTRSWLALLGNAPLIFCSTCQLIIGSVEYPDNTGGGTGSIIMEKIRVLFLGKQSERM